MSLNLLNSPGPSPSLPTDSRKVPDSEKNRISVGMATAMVPSESRVASRTRWNSCGSPVPEAARSSRGASGTLHPSESPHRGEEDSTMRIPRLSRCEVRGDGFSDTQPDRRTNPHSLAVADLTIEPRSSAFARLGSGRGPVRGSLEPPCITSQEIG